MNIFVVVTISSMLADLISCETTKESATDKNNQQTLASSIRDFANLEKDGSNPRLNSLWVYRPATQLQDAQIPDEMVKMVEMKPAHSLTRLAKTLSLGFDPFFSKGYFEPFERRPKPVTLVAFRKNGLLPQVKSNGKMPESKSAEIAELQSPFNDVSNFWVDD